MAIQKYSVNPAVQPETKYAALSTQLHIAVTDRFGGAPIGGIQAFTPTQTRSVDRIRHFNVFNPGEIVDMVPGNIQGTINVTKLWFHTGRLLQVFAPPEKGSASVGLRPNRHDPWKAVSLLEAQLPFNVEVWYKHPESGEAEILETYIDCVISSHSFTISASGNLLITETANIEFKDRVLGQFKPDDSQAQEDERQKWANRFRQDQEPPGLGTLETPPIVPLAFGAALRELVLRRSGTTPTQLNLRRGAPTIGVDTEAHAPQA